MPFIGDLDVRLTRDDPAGDWTLLASFAYQDADGVIHAAPAGFQTDFASVPRLPFIYAMLGNTVRKAGTVHDWLYTTKRVSRLRADQLLREMIESEGDPPLVAAAFFWAVHLFGGSHWR